MRRWLAKIGEKTLYITPGSPSENGYCESFHGQMRDALLNGEIYYTLAKARIPPVPLRSTSGRPGRRRHNNALTIKLGHSVGADLGRGGAFVESRLMLVLPDVSSEISLRAYSSRYTRARVTEWLAEGL